MNERASSAPLGDTVEEIAAVWVAREAKGELSSRDNDELDTWLSASGEHRLAYERARDAYDVSADWASAPEILAMRREALALAERPRSSGQWQVRAWGLALAAGLALVLFGLTRLSDRAPVPHDANDASVNGAVEASAPRDHYVTAVGERLTATLSDGSVLTLNTNSEVRVHYSDVARRIELVRGQAFFSVAHRPDWPFLVEAAGKIVRALGTQFEVRRGGSGIEVILVEGRVAVGDSGAVLRGDLTHAVEMQSGERLVSAARTYEVAAIDTDRATSWRSGRVFFSAMPLPEAIAEINRYRTQPLVIEDPQVAHLTLSGAFRTADANSFGEALSASLPVEERALPDGRTLLVHKSSASEAH